MRELAIDQIKSDAQTLERRFDEFLKFLGELTDPQGKAFDVSVPIPDTDSSVSDLRARSAAIAGLIRKLDSKGGALLPIASSNGISNSVRALRNAFNQITSNINDHMGAQGPIQNIDQSNGVVIVSSNGQQIDLQPQFKGIFDSFESYLQFFQSVFQSVHPSRAAFNFSSATKALSLVITRASQSRDSLNKALMEATAKLVDIQSRNDESQKHLSTTIENDRLISEAVAKSSESVASISARNDEATNLGAITNDLKIAVERYRTEFDSFQIELDSRKGQIDAGNSALDDLVKKLKTQDEQFDSLIEKSNQMLSGATVAGLASEFGTIRSSLSTEVTAAHKSFNIAIVILAISALPLILFIFAPFIGPIVSDDARVINAIVGLNNERNGWQYVGQVIARLVILLPAIWYVTFCSMRYNSLFKLREHYSYKYSMAVAVEGFKKQSPGHEDMVAALGRVDKRLQP